MWQFAFSCRVLGMGVEQWVYDMLGRPKFEIVGEVLSQLDFTPDWINKTADRDSNGAETSALPDVRIRGGCELEILEHFFRAEAKSTKSEVVGPRGRYVAMRNHSSLLAHALRGLSPEQSTSFRQLGFGPEDLRSAFFENCPAGSLLVFSPTADAFYPVYQHRTNGLRTPVNILHLGDPEGKGAEVVEYYFDSQNLDENERRAFAGMKTTLAADFIRAVADWDRVLVDDYRTILQNSPKDSLLVVLLPNSVMINNGNVEENQIQTQLNDLFRNCVAPTANIVFIEMRELVDPATEIVDTFIHYRRSVYFRLFKKSEPNI